MLFLARLNQGEYTKPKTLWLIAFWTIIEFSSFIFVKLFYLLNEGKPPIGYGHIIILLLYSFIIISFILLNIELTMQVTLIALSFIMLGFFQCAFWIPFHFFQLNQNINKPALIAICMIFIITNIFFYVLLIIKKYAPKYLNYRKNP